MGNTALFCMKFEDNNAEYVLYLVPKKQQIGLEAKQCIYRKERNGVLFGPRIQ